MRLGMPPGKGEEVIGERERKVPKLSNRLIQRASTAVADILREAILYGQLSPGEHIREEELAHDLGVSRTPIREALLMLTQEGLVDSDAHRGSRVRSYTLEEIDEIYQIRAQLEGYGSSRAAERMTDHDGEILREACKRFAQTQELTQNVRENLYFHNYILDLADAPRLRAIVQPLISLPIVYKSFFWKDGQQHQIAISHHKEITNTLIAKDSEQAERLMRAHVLGARDHLLHALPRLHSD